jgi:hypothetical protein
MAHHNKMRFSSAEMRPTGERDEDDPHGRFHVRHLEDDAPPVASGPQER